MKNDYESAELIEIGVAQAHIQGNKDHQFVLECDTCLERAYTISSDQDE